MTSLETFKKVLNYVKKYAFLLVLSFVFSFLSVIIQLYIPKCFGKEIDFFNWDWKG